MIRIAVLALLATSAVADIKALSRKLEEGPPECIYACDGAAGMVKQLSHVTNEEEGMMLICKFIGDAEMPLEDSCLSGCDEGSLMEFNFVAAMCLAHATGDFESVAHLEAQMDNHEDEHEPHTPQIQDCSACLGCAATYKDQYKCHIEEEHIHASEAVAMFVNECSACGDWCAGDLLTKKCEWSELGQSMLAPTNVAPHPSPWDYTEHDNSETSDCSACLPCVMQFKDEYKCIVEDADVTFIQTCAHCGEHCSGIFLNDELCELTELGQQMTAVEHQSAKEFATAIAAVDETFDLVGLSSYSNFDASSFLGSMASFLEADQESAALEEVEVSAENAATSESKAASPFGIAAVAIVAVVAIAFAVVRRRSQALQGQFPPMQPAAGDGASSWL